MRSGPLEVVRVVVASVYNVSAASAEAQAEPTRFPNWSDAEGPPTPPLMTCPTYSHRMAEAGCSGRLEAKATPAMPSRAVVRRVRRAFRCMGLSPFGAAGEAPP